MHDGMAEITAVMSNDSVLRFWLRGSMDMLGFVCACECVPAANERWRIRRIHCLIFPFTLYIYIYIASVAMVTGDHHLHTPSVNIFMRIMPASQYIIRLPR